MKLVFAACGLLLLIDLGFDALPEPATGWLLLGGGWLARRRAG